MEWLEVAEWLDGRRHYEEHRALIERTRIAADPQLSLEVLRIFDRLKRSPSVSAVRGACESLRQAKVNGKNTSSQPIGARLQEIPPTSRQTPCPLQVPCPPVAGSFNKSVVER